MSATAQSRRNGPQTSLVAAAKHERRGTAERNRKILIQLIRDNAGGITAGELAALTNGLFDHVEACRRLSEISSEVIHHDGQRDCRVKGSKMRLWWFGPLPTTMTQAEMF